LKIIDDSIGGIDQRLCLAGCQLAAFFKRLDRVDESASVIVMYSFYSCENTDWADAKERRSKVAMKKERKVLSIRISFL
jgi:hypothetical protein